MRNAIGDHALHHGALPAAMSGYRFAMSSRHERAPDQRTISGM
jgi:hypothetical protein